MTLPRYSASRYVHPLREGGSLPAVVETENGLWVVKFRGAGQGAKVLVAELIVGNLAALIGLPTPELALIEVSSRFGRSEPDSEIQELLRRSHGTNVGMRFLEGAFNFDPRAASEFISPEFAAKTAWLDAFTTNPDRTGRNPNLMIWERKAWLIDHGAALYAHYDWSQVDDERTRTPFQMIRSHILLRDAADLTTAAEEIGRSLGGDAIERAVSTVPDDLLMDPVGGRLDFATPEEARARYVRYLRTRLDAQEIWLSEAKRAQQQLRVEAPQQLKARR